MARPSIVPIALTVDDRTGYTLWAPPWDEDGEEWQAFLGSTQDGVARVHLFPDPTALQEFCRTATDHDLIDHPVWPVVLGLPAADLTPDEDHRFDLDGVYDIAAENPDRWAVEELAATLDIAGRLAECCDVEPEDDDSEDDDSEGDDSEGDDSDEDLEEDDHEDDEDPAVQASATGATSTAAADDDDDDDEVTGGFESLAELMRRPETGLLGFGIDAFVGRPGEEAWIRLGSALDDLWEDVVEELSDHLDWTAASGVALTAYPTAAEDAERDRLEALGGADETDDDLDEDDEDDDEPLEELPAQTPARRTAAGGATSVGVVATPGVSTIRGGSRVTATAAEVAAAAEFWEAVGILPVEVVVPEGSGVTLRCYVDDEARFLGRDGEVFLFPTPADLTRFCAGDEEHDLTEITSWPEVVTTDAAPLPAEEDRYDLTAVSEVLTEVADGATGLVQLDALLQPLDGVRDLAEYAGLDRVEQLLGGSTSLGRSVARAEREPSATVTAADAAVLAPAWDELVREVGSALVFRD